MNISRVYTRQIFVTRPSTPRGGEGSIPHAVNIWGVYTLHIFTVGPYTPCGGEHNPQNECLGGLHRPNIQCWSLYQCGGESTPHDHVMND